MSGNENEIEKLLPRGVQIQTAFLKSYKIIAE